MLKVNYTNNSINIIAKHINSLCIDDLELASKVASCKKTAEDCYDYIVKKARNYLKNKSGCIEDKIVFEWALHYFLEGGKPSDGDTEKVKPVKKVNKVIKKKEDKKYEQYTLF